MVRDPWIVEEQHAEGLEVSGPLGMWLSPAKTSAMVKTSEIRSVVAKGVKHCFAHQDISYGKNKS